MNKLHLEYCASDEWAALIAGHIIPWVTGDGDGLGGRLLEVGPGPGRTTELLMKMAGSLTAVEIDHDLATALAARLAGTNVTVVEADATALPFPEASFDAAISLTMLHHVPSPELQDRIFEEVSRVLSPGAIFVASDNLDSPHFRDGHIDDICVPIDPATLTARLERAGFTEVEVETNPFAWRCRALRGA